MDIVSIATYFIAFMIATEVVNVVRNKSRSGSHTDQLLRGLRPRHFLRGFAVVVLTVLSYLALDKALPMLDVGWWSWLGGKGSILFGQSNAADAASAPPTLRLLPFVLPFGLLVILPRAALLEERLFRRGTQHQSLAVRTRRQGVFGLMHLLMGIPLTAALALVVTGFAYQHIYLRRYAQSGLQGIAVLEAARTHLAANLLIVGLAYLGLVASQ